MELLLGAYFKIYPIPTCDRVAGGKFRIVVATTGFEIISEEDCKELHYRYADEKKK